jgi:hypothetical protein
MLLFTVKYQEKCLKLKYGKRKNRMEEINTNTNLSRLEGEKVKEQGWGRWDHKRSDFDHSQEGSVW